nr:isoform 2 of probable indole-3-pyruvate monooxygenase yucca4 [Quercus suber]
MQEQVAIIVGAGTSGLAIAACLSQQSIPFIILEREDCIASLWKKYSYDRLHLHLAKELCELPYMSFPASYPKYVPKNMFTQYVDDYVSHFKISPMYQRNVESAEYNEVSKRWFVKARNASSGFQKQECFGCWGWKFWHGDCFRPCKSWCQNFHYCLKSDSYSLTRDDGLCQNFSEVFKA